MVTRTMTSSIEYLETFVGKNYLDWLKWSISQMKCFVGFRPNVLPVANNLIRSPPTRFLLILTQNLRKAALP